MKKQKVGSKPIEDYECYDNKVNLYSGLNLPLVHQIEKHLKTLNNKPEEIIILDVGCGPGTLGKYFKKSGHNVWGVDISPKAIEKASRNLDKAMVLDIEKKDPMIGKNKFDVIIFSDILEHTYRPAVILNKYQNYLKTSGVIAISIPNIANYTVRLKLLIGSSITNLVGF